MASKYWDKYALESPAKTSVKPTKSSSYWDKYAVETSDDTQEIKQQSAEPSTGLQRQLGIAGIGAFSGAIGAPAEAAHLIPRLANYLLNKTVRDEPVNYQEKLGEINKSMQDTFLRNLEIAQKTIQDPKATFLDKSAAFNFLAQASEANINAGTTSDVSQALNQATGDRFQPQGTAEKLLSAAATGAGGGLALGGLGAIVPGSLSGVGAQSAAELGAPDEVQVLAGIFGGSSPSLAKSGAAAVKSATSRGPELAASAVKLSDKLTPKAFLPDVDTSLGRETRAAAQRAGVELPPSLVTDSPTISALEGIISKIDPANKTSTAFRKQIADNIVSGFDKTFAQVSDTPLQNAYETASSIQEGIKASAKIAKDRSAELYAKLEEATPDNIVIKHPENLAQAVDDIIKSLEGPVKSAEQQATLSKIQDIKASLYETKSSKKLSASGEGPLRLTNEKIVSQKNVPLKDLLSIRTAINDIVNFETQGGSKKLLNKVGKEIDTLLDAYGEMDPAFGKARRDATENFREMAKTFRNDKISKAIFTESPESILKLGDSISGIKQVEAALKSQPEGRKLFQDFKKAKLEEIFAKPLSELKDTQGGLSELPKSLNLIREVLKDPKKKAIIRELAGNEVLSRLQDLAKVSEGLIKNSQKFLEGDVGIVGQGLQAAKTLTALTSMLTISPVGLATSYLWFAAPEYSAQLITNPRFLREMTTLARVAEKPVTPKNTQIFNDQLGKVMGIAISIANEVDSQSE